MPCSARGRRAEAVALRGQAAAPTGARRCEGQGVLHMDPGVIFHGTGGTRRVGDASKPTLNGAAKRGDLHPLPGGCRAAWARPCEVAVQLGHSVGKDHAITMCHAFTVPIPVSGLFRRETVLEVT